MSGDDRNGERGRSKAPPARTGSTIQGMPQVAPPAAPVEPADEAPPQAPVGRNRVTMDFSGPPLTLPTDPPEEYEREEQRTGWASELDSPSPPEDREPHDAWAVDRKRRSTPPMAMPAVVPPPRAPMPPLPRPSVGARPWSVPPTLAPRDEGDALGLVDRSRRSSSQPAIDLAADMAERYALDDFSGALRSAELLLGSDPANVEAQRYAQSCRDRLVQLYSSRLGPLSQLVRVIVPDREVRWLGLDHRAGFLLSRIDGEHSVEETIDMSGMPRLEALKTLAGLVDAGAIRLEPG